MDDLTGVMSLLEGHADVVMDDVGPDVIPSVTSIRKKFTRRRQGVGVLDKLLRRALGLDAKMAQYRDGARFVRGVVDKVGMADFNVVWQDARPPAHQGRDRRSRRVGDPGPLVTGPDPAVAATRVAVRRALAVGDPRSAPVLVACSGGADSLALLAAAVFEARDRPWSVVGVTVDHGLHDASPEVTTHVVGQMAALGADETASIRVKVEGDGHGLEAAARQARYAVLEELADRFGSTTVLLGHTLDDQAETVLLGLTRGSGGRSLAGMRRTFGVFRRPLLDLTRAQTERACRAQDIGWWTDPANEDPRFTRSRVRRDVLPLLETELGPGVAQNLARTADLLRADVEHLDELAERGVRQPLHAAARRRSARARAGDPLAGAATGGAGCGCQRRGAVPRPRTRPRRAADRLARPGCRRPAGPGPRRSSRWDAGVRGGLTLWQAAAHGRQPRRAGPRERAVHREADPGPPRRAGP